MLKNKHKEDIKNENNNTENSNNLETKETEVVENDEINKQTEESTLLRKILNLEQANEELKDKYLRIVAEYDNYRRRTAKEKLEMADSIKSNIMLNFLPVVDDMNRALTFLNSNNTDDFSKNIEGINLIAEKFMKFLASNGVVEIDAKNKEFDVDLHEAITKFQVQDENQKGKVIDIVQSGYKMNDKVIRFAKVVVGE